MKDPFAQAQLCMHWLMGEFATLPKKWMPSLGYGLAFPNGEYREQAHPNAPRSTWWSITGTWASSPRASRS